MNGNIHETVTPYQQQTCRPKVDRRPNRIYVLKFCASLIRHVGLIESEGHFAASVERKIKNLTWHGENFELQKIAALAQVPEV